MPAYLKTFAEIPVYSDEGSQNQICRDILPAGIVPGVEVGYNILDGPGHTERSSHTWDQIFVVVQGRGILGRGEERIPLQAHCIALIPAGIEHYVQVAPGERIEYVYVNKHPCCSHPASEPIPAEER